MGKDRAGTVQPGEKDQDPRDATEVDKYLKEWCKEGMLGSSEAIEKTRGKGSKLKHSELHFC